MRHRARPSSGDQALHVPTTHTYREALNQVPTAPDGLRSDDLGGPRPRPAPRCPTASTSCRRAGTHGAEEFAAWAAGAAPRLLMEDFYRNARRPVRPADGRLRAGRRAVELRRREPRAAAERTARHAWASPTRLAGRGRDRRRGPRDLDAGSATGLAFVGEDGPRLFAATREEALARAGALHRAPAAGFGPHEDAMLADDRWMAHSLLSAPLNLGLLDPLEVAGAGRAGLPRRATARCRSPSRASCAR